MFILKTKNNIYFDDKFNFIFIYIIFLNYIFLALLLYIIIFYLKK